MNRKSLSEILDKVLGACDRNLSRALQLQSDFIRASFRAADSMAQHGRAAELVFSWRGAVVIGVISSIAWNRYEYVYQPQDFVDGRCAGTESAWQTGMAPCEVAYDPKTDSVVTNPLYEAWEITNQADQLAIRADELIQRLEENGLPGTNGAPTRVLRELRGRRAALTASP